MSRVKVQKMEKQVEREVSKILISDAKDDSLHSVTVTGVDLTNDMSLAKVYYTVLGNDDKRDALITRLTKAKGFIRSDLASRLNVRHVPELEFIFDESIEYGNKIEKILEDIKK